MENELDAKDEDAAWYRIRGTLRDHVEHLNAEHALSSSVVHSSIESEGESHRG